MIYRLLFETYFPYINSKGEQMLNIIVPKYGLRYVAEIYKCPIKKYFVAYLPDFGDKCLVTGKTAEEAIVKLEKEAYEVVSYYKYFEMSLPINRVGRA